MSDSERVKTQAEIKRLRPNAEYDPTVWNEIEVLIRKLEGG